MSQPDRLTVLQLVGNLDIGGAQQVVVTLAKYLATTGNRPIVCSFRDGPLRSDIEALGIPVVLVPGRKRSALAVHTLAQENMRIRRTLAEVVEQHRIDVIQTHLLRSLDFLTATLPRRGGIPLVYWTFHNSNFTLRREHLPSHRWLLKPKQLSYRWLYRLGSRRVSGLIAVSDEVRQSMLDEIGSVDDKIVVIANGVDVELYGEATDSAALRSELELEPNDFVMVMVGTFKRQKGHIHLVEAASRLREAHPSVRILLVGDGELRAEMEEKARQAKLDEMLRFMGSRRDIPRLLAASDGFVLPSLWEGLPIALLEAMAAGLPCIATDVSGTKQVVVPDETGMLIPPGDSSALAKAMEELLADPDRARRMGEAGKRRVESLFSARNQTEDHVRRFRSDWPSTR
jgi:glycosyltransferase involved in cell wall biosynthesis